MHKHQLSRFASLALVVGAIAVPAASAGAADLRNPDNRAPKPGVAAQDLRNPDNRAPVGGTAQDLRSPDAVDAAAGRGTFSAPDVVVVKVKEPQPTAGGIDWNDVGIGAGGLVGIMLVSLGGALFVVQRRHARAAYQP